MPLAKIHDVEGRYEEGRIAKVSDAIQAALMNTLRVPPEDFYQLIFEFPKKRFLHTPSFVGMHYTDDLIILDLTFIEGRSKETRLALLKDVYSRVAAAARVSPDDLMITLSTQSKERLAVDLEFIDGAQIAVITLIDTARDNASQFGRKMF
jgi:hypothetical protein